MPTASRSTSGSVDAALVVRQVVGGFQPRAAELGIELGLAAGGPATCLVRADSDRLGQVLANLVENSASFAAHRVEVGLREGPAGAVLWVDDDGPGIPPDQLTRVFDRHVTTDREGSAAGSGLGLTIVRELATAMGGSVHAESPLVDGAGTRMVVELRAPADRAPADHVAGVHPGGSWPPSSGSSTSVQAEAGNAGTFHQLRGYPHPLLEAHPPS